MRMLVASLLSKEYFFVLQIFDISTQQRMCAAICIIKGCAFKNLSFLTIAPGRLGIFIKAIAFGTMRQYAANKTNLKVLPLENLRLNIVVVQKITPKDNIF